MRDIPSDLQERVNLMEERSRSEIMVKRPLEERDAMVAEMKTKLMEFEQQSVAASHQEFEHQDIGASSQWPPSQRRPLSRQKGWASSFDELMNGLMAALLMLVTVNAV
jgi:hypothetical protein